MIVFQNRGELDINAIKTMGVSVKDEGAIGYFGTGLKYAIAVLLREKQKITIWTGKQRLDFATEELVVRGRRFDLVTMNGESLGFTTELGKNWEMWMAFRELYCNCKDERGEVIDGKAQDLKIEFYDAFPEEGITTVVVQGDDFQAEYAKRHENFVEGAPLFSDGNVEVYETGSPHVFYKGVRVYTPENKPVLTYNLLQPLDLTEDRTVKYYWEVDAPIKKAIAKMTDEFLLYRTICAPQFTFERRLDINGDDCSPEFEQMALREYKNDQLKVNSGIIKLVNRVAAGGDLHKPLELTFLQMSQLDKAIAFLKKLGYDVTPYKLKVVRTLGPTVLAQAHRVSSTITVSEQCFDHGTKFLAAALLEEIIHLREGLSDNSTAMQSFLFKKIISMGEELQGEVL